MAISNLPLTPADNTWPLNKYYGFPFSLLYSFWKGLGIPSALTPHPRANAMPSATITDHYDHSVRGRTWMKTNAGRMTCVTQSTDEQASVEIFENFAQLLILEATGDRSLVTLVEPDNGKWNYFQGKGQLTTERYPDDLDTTSLALTVMPCEETLAHTMMDEMLNYLSDDGISMVYFDHNRPRFDTGICVNTLSLFYYYGRGQNLPGTLNWVHEVLRDRTYVATGTRYYEPDCFLFFIHRLLGFSNDPELHATLEPLLRERIQERFGVEGDAIARAMRIIVADFLGIRDTVDLQALLPLQAEDGGWEIGWMYRYGNSRIRIGSRGLATALSVKAIELMRASDPSTT